MATESKNRFTIISNNNYEIEAEQQKTVSGHSNPFYEKLLTFRNLQEQQKKRFTVDDLLKW